MLKTIKQLISPILEFEDLENKKNVLKKNETRTIISFKR